MKLRAPNKLLMALAAIATVIALTWGVLRREPKLAIAQHPAPIPASTTSVTQAAVTPRAVPAPAPTDFMGIVRAAYADFPATEPLAIPAELHEGARVILHEPIFLDSAGELWITRPDAPATPKVLKNAADEQVHLTREHVLFVHHLLDDTGTWKPQIICTDPDGNFVLISSDIRLNLGKQFDYEWARAFDWNSTSNEGFVVPTPTGVSIFRPRSLPVEVHYDFKQSRTASTATVAPDATQTTSLSPKPQMLLDSRGLLAWIPWEEGRPGSRGAARFVDGAWQPLGPDQGWPEKILHLVPLIGGGVLQLVPDDNGIVTESLAQLDTATVDEKTVDPLIEQLSDPDPKVRDTASDELTRYGPGLWPILEKVINDQPPEGHMRIERLLAAKQAPTLGRMTLLPGKVRVLSHLQDGFVVLLAYAGVSVPNHDPALPPIVTAPAYISIRPDRPIDLAPAALVKDLPPGSRFDIAPDEWIVTDDTQGPRRLLGNHLEPLLRKSERTFSQFVGIDRKGRWLFREPGHRSPTLVLDPNLPDATPRLAAWIQPVNCDVVGWDDAGWPVVMKNDNAWALHAEEWSPLPAAGQGRKFYKSLDDMPPAGTRAATTTTTQSSLILSGSGGSTYYDGQSTFELHRPDGSTLRWTLPPEAVGSGEVHLVRTADNHLFLFNQPGRVLRILPTTNPTEPFKLEATFTRQIPNADHYTRIWLDPAGRIDLEYDTNHLTILFPDGRIPLAIAEKMPAEQTKGDEQ